MMWPLGTVCYFGFTISGRTYYKRLNTMTWPCYKYTPRGMIFLVKNYLNLLVLSNLIPLYLYRWNNIPSGVRACVPPKLHHPLAPVTRDVSHLPSLLTTPWGSLHNHCISHHHYYHYHRYRQYHHNPNSCNHHSGGPDTDRPH